MAEYRVIFTRYTTADRIVAMSERLAAEPRPVGAPKNYEVRRIFGGFE